MKVMLEIVIILIVNWVRLVGTIDVAHVSKFHYYPLSCIFSNVLCSASLLQKYTHLQPNQLNSLSPFSNKVRPSSSSRASSGNCRRAVPGSPRSRSNNAPVILHWRTRHHRLPSEEEPLLESKGKSPCSSDCP